MAKSENSQLGYACKCHYYMTIFANGPDGEIQQFDWFLSGLHEYESVIEQDG